MNYVTQSVFRNVVALASCLALAACGGGDSDGGGGGGSPQPVAQPGTLQISGAVSVDENAGTAQLTITRTGGSDGAVSVTVASADGAARAGQDFTAINTVVNFAAGDAAAKTVTISIVDDTVAEPQETFVVNLVSPTGGAQLGAVTTATVTIRDNEPPPAAPTVALSAAIKQLTFTWRSVPGATSYRLLLNPDGASSFTQVGADYPSDAVSASIEVAVHRHDWVNALYRIEACNVAGCSASSSVTAIDAMVRAIGYFKASNTDGSDQFGNSVALSADGRTLAVGAAREDSAATTVDGDASDNSAGDAGAVYIFTRDGTQWSQQAYVKASNAGSLDRFGSAVALSADGSVLAVGAPFEDSNAKGVNGEPLNEAAVDSGAVYVFVRDGAAWSQQTYVKASNTGGGDQFGTGDQFGSAVALSADGNTLAVGAPFEDSAATGVNGDQGDSIDGQNSGATYVFTRDGMSWSQRAYVKASNPDADDIFGSLVALSADGNTLAVSATLEDSGTIDDPNNDAVANSGAVYVFGRDGTQWSQQAYVKASNADVGDVFGFSLALSDDGSTLAVGASQEDSTSIDVGGEQENDGALESGAVYVFTRDGTRWSQQAYVKASNTEAGDNFGKTVALSADGSTLAVGAPRERSGAIGVGGDQDNNSATGSGAVYVFTRAETQWSQRAYVKASNTGEGGDAFGSSLALSDDGNTLVVSAELEDSNATGVSGAGQDNNEASAAGAVYVF